MDGCTQSQTATPDPPQRIMLRRFACAGLLAMASAVSACNGPQRSAPVTPAEHRRRVMIMAAREASDIRDVSQRLSRLLNVAHRQFTSGQAPDGRITLGHARAALIGDDAAALSAKRQLAGWISISQLARRNGYTRFAAGACDRGVAVLKKIDPAIERCRFVHPVAWELSQARSHAAASELLHEAALWPVESNDLNRRREIYARIASDLMAYGDYVGGQNVLKCENDPVWRSRVLEALAVRSVAPGDRGEDLSFETNFYVPPPATQPTRQPTTQPTR